MLYRFCQTVRIVDMNQELLTETVFHHGNFALPVVTPGCFVKTHILGLKEFDVVYDTRQQETIRSRVIDLEVDLTSPEEPTVVHLEPITLIIGQHDVGQID